MSISANLPGFVIRLLITSGVLAAASYGLMHYNILAVMPADVLFTYIYLIALTTASYTVVLLAGSTKYDRAGFAFLGLALIKLMISFAFLWPKISSDDEAAKPYLLHFFALYFIYLFIEAMQVVKVIRLADPNKELNKDKDLSKGG
jgi:hypothetical protein